VLNFYVCSWVSHLHIKEEEKERKAFPWQAWSGPEVSSKLRFPDLMTMAQAFGKVVSLMHRPPLPLEMLLVLISVRGWVDHRAIVRLKGFYVNEKFQWHQLGSNKRPSEWNQSTGPRTEPCDTPCLTLAQSENLLLFSMSLYISVLQCLLSTLIVLETLTPSLKKKIISILTLLCFISWLNKQHCPSQSNIQKIKTKFNVVTTFANWISTKYF